MPPIAPRLSPRSRVSSSGAIRCSVRLRQAQARIGRRLLADGDNISSGLLSTLPSIVGFAPEVSSAKCPGATYER